MSVHLGENNITQGIMEKIIIGFGLEKPNLGASFTQGFGVIQNEDQMEQSNSLKQIVTSMFEDSSKKLLPNEPH